MPLINTETLSQAKSRFEEAWKVRKEWDALLQRQWPVQLQPELAAVQEGIDYETPDLEKALQDHKDVLQMNPTFYDVAALDESPAARKKAREILLWTGRGWEYENENRWWDSDVAEGQVRHGYKAMRLLHRPQSEPDIAASTGEEVGSSAAAQSAQDTLDARNEEFKRRRHPFHWQSCNIYNVSWLGDEKSEYGPDVFFMEYQIPYLDAQAEVTRKGEKLTLDTLGKVAWLGEGEDGDNSNWQDQTVTVVVVDARDPKNRKCRLPGCDHYQRIIQVYVMPDGQTELSPECLASESDSPFPGCSFFVIPGRRTASDDPNLRFRPLMHGLYVESNTVNYITTLLLTEIRSDYSNNDLYLDVSAVTDPGLLPEDREQGSYVDFQALPREGQLQYLPGEVRRLPKNISPHLTTLRQEHMQRLGEYKPNRFVTGQAFTEASNATGTAFIQQAQQAALPYNTLLSAADGAQKASRLYEYHAIKWWALAEPEGAQTRYYAVTSGSQSSVKLGGDTPAAGHVVYMTADKLSMDFDLVIRTKSETLAEEGARWLQAKDQYLTGAIDPEQLMRAAGVDDVEGQKQKLEYARQAAAIEPEYQMLEKQAAWKHFYGLTGVNIEQFTTRPPAPQQPAERPQGQPQSQPAQANGTNVISPNNMLGRSMQQAVVSGPDGGGSPVGR